MKARTFTLSLPVSIALSACIGACTMEPPYVSEAEFAARRGDGSGSSDAGSTGTTAGSDSGPVTQGGSGPSNTAGSSSSTGGSAETSGGSDSTGTGGSNAGSSPTAGSSTGGSVTAGGSGGAAPLAGSGGGPTEDYLQVTKALDGLRIDDPCTGSPSTSKGATCTHVTNPYHVKKEVTIAGTAGKTYDVVLRIRGVVEPTKISGGTRADTTTVTIDNVKFRTMPYTVGGTPGDPTYQPWLLSVSAPAQNYFFNDHGNTAHLTFLLDYQVTVPMAAGAKITLDVNDANDHEIDNYDKKSNPGIPGSMNLGQYVQVNVVSVTPRQ